MLVAAAVCPHPPLLVPAAMGAGGPGDDSQICGLRAACGEAVAGLAAARPDLIVVVGGADQTADYEASAAGTLRSFGVTFTIGSGEPVLPLSLTVGAWLLRRFLAADGVGLPPSAAIRDVAASGLPLPAAIRDVNGVAVAPWLVRLQAVRQSLPTAACLRLGAELAGRAPRVALLVMGDGSARKAVGVHGAADPPAEEYDAAVAAALAAADAGALARLDAALDDELMVAGRAAWQVLAGAAVGGGLRGQVRFAAAPLDVTYLVASWAR